jgi:putative Holliday junction resolvase
MVDASPVKFESAYTTTVPVTGTVTEQTVPATGEVELRNIAAEAVTIPAGTELGLEVGVSYRTITAVELDGGSPERPAEGRVAIESVTGGDGANAQPGTLVGPLDGIAGVYYANLDGPVEGGEGRSVPGVSQEDTEAIIALAKTELDKQAATATVDGGARVVPSSLEPQGEITYTFSHETGDPAESLAIDASMTYTALAIDPTAVSQLADETLRANLASSAPAGYEVDPATIAIGTADGVSGDAEGLMRIPATAEARATLDDAEREALAAEMAGRQEGGRPRRRAGLSRRGRRVDRRKSRLVDRQSALLGPNQGHRGVRALGRYLGLDVGAKRIGIAVSDEMGTIASPVSYVARGSGELTAFQDLVRRYQPIKLVAGLPAGMSGYEGPQAKSVRIYTDALARQLGIELVYWDERLTTAIAERQLIAGGARRDKRREQIDALAASIMLQSYLDSESHERRSTVPA